MLPALCVCFRGCSEFHFWEKLLLHESPSFQEKTSPLELSVLVFTFISLTTGCHCNSRHEKASPGGLQERPCWESWNFVVMMGQWVFSCLGPKTVKPLCCYVWKAVGNYSEVTSVSLTVFFPCRLALGKES